MTGQDLRNRVVTAAQGWLGRKESDGSHRAIIDLYNSHKPLARSYPVKYTDPWCAAFVSAAAIKAGLTGIIPTECGCEEYIKRFRALGAWIEEDDYIPSPGDYIFYDWQDDGKGDCTGRADHVGIVTSCDGKTVRVIEGNLNNAVGYRTLTVNGRYIRGYGVPDYASLADEPGKKEPCTVPTVPAPPCTVPTAPAPPWWQPYADWAVEQGIADGTRGDEPCTRGECWAMLKRLSGGK